jgi:hypothetical protein
VLTSGRHYMPEQRVRVRVPGGTRLAVVLQDRGAEGVKIRWRADPKVLYPIVVDRDRITEVVVGGP